VNGRDNRGRRRPRGRDSGRQDRSSGGEGNFRDGRAKGDFHQRNNGEKSGYINKGVLSERPSWSAPAPVTKPLPVLNCIRCGLPITDLHSALSDRNNGEPVHFDCVMTELTELEKPEAGDILSYIGGGRFGIVHFNNGKGEQKNFTIKKILEWEDKEKKTEWRGAIADRYSIT
jgi:hypothetical protein